MTRLLENKDIFLLNAWLIERAERKAREGVMEEREYMRGVWRSQRLLEEEGLVTLTTVCILEDLSDEKLVPEGQPCAPANANFYCLLSSSFLMDRYEVVKVIISFCNGCCFFHSMFHQLIGKGGEGTVYLVQHKETTEQLICKNVFVEI